MRSPSDRPSSQQLWETIQEQNRKIAALERLHKRSRFTASATSIRLMAVATVIIAAVAGIGAASAAQPAASPITANVIHGCYAKTGGLSVTAAAKCPRGTTALPWNQFNSLTAGAPLSVTAGVKGSPPKLSLTGVVPVANGGTGASTQNFVDLTNNQSVAGAKTFSSTIHGDITGNAGTVTHGLYDTGSYANPSWLTSLDGAKITGVVPVANGGTGASTQNFVDLTNNQSVAGAKTFSSTIHGDITGNAGTVSHGLYDTGSYANPPWLTSLAGAKITGAVPIANAATNAFEIGGRPVKDSSLEVPGTGDVLRYDENSNEWSPSRSAMNLRRVAQLRWYDVNRAAPTIATGANPLDVAFDGAHMWVSNNGTNTVTEIDAGSNAVLNTITVGSGPRGLAFDGTHIWVANHNSGTASEIDIATHAVINTVTVGAGPLGAAFDGTHVWIANGNDNTVSEIDIATHAVINTLAAGNDPDEMTFDGTTLWVSDFVGNTVTLINVATPSTGASIASITRPQGMAFDGSYIWVVGQTGSIAAYDTFGQERVQFNNLGQLNGVAFDGTYLWVTDGTNNKVYRIDPETLNFVDFNTALPGRPFGIAFDGSNMWVAQVNNNTVAKM